MQTSERGKRRFYRRSQPWIKTYIGRINRCGIRGNKQLIKSCVFCSFHGFSAPPGSERCLFSTTSMFWAWMPRYPSSVWGHKSQRLSGRQLFCSRRFQTCAARKNSRAGERRGAPADCLQTMRGRKRPDLRFCWGEKWLNKGRKEETFWTSRYILIDRGWEFERIRSSEIN